VCVVPASVERLRRDNVAYRPLDEHEAVSPIIMSCRKDDRSPEIACLLDLVQAVYGRDGVEFGA
jgi:LysR family transcriptional regulator, benzoate and cis,cis-muconate-responsive activator of ben and cat genes